MSAEWMSFMVELVIGVYLTHGNSFNNLKCVDCEKDARRVLHCRESVVLSEVEVQAYMKYSVPKRVLEHTEEA